MQKEILLQMLAQNKSDCSYTFKRITVENSTFRLTEKTASVGFIYRHIGETTNLIGQFFGHKTDIVPTTIGQVDKGEKFDLEESHKLFETGYKTIETIINTTADNDWFGEIETTWFGKISRIKLLSILLSHNSHHCGQIASAIVKGR